MVSSQRQNRIAELGAKLLVNSMMAVLVCACCVIPARAQDAQPSAASGSSASTAQTSVDDANSTRTTETHSTSSNGTVDNLTLEQLDGNGGYSRQFETEKDTIKVDPSTTRTVERTYQYDANGQKSLVQVNEETRTSAADGNSQVVRTTSKADGEGKLQLIQRDNAATTATSPDSQETKSTSYLIDSNGNLVPSLQTVEQQKRGADNTIQANTTTLLPDSSGAWKVGEVKQSTVKQDGKNRTSDESVSRADLEGHFSEVSRTVSQVTEVAPGEVKKTVETYSPDLPGSQPDGTLHLNSRVTTVQKKDSTGEVTEQQIEQPKLDEPRSGLQVSGTSKSVVHYTISGTQTTKTDQTRDVNGILNPATVETQKTDKVPAADAQTAPSEKSQ